MSKVYIYILGIFLGITQTVSFQAMDTEIPHSSVSFLQKLSDEMFLNIVDMLVTPKHIIKNETLVTNNALIKALVCIKIVCKQFNSLLSDPECTILMKRMAMVFDTIFMQKLEAAESRWLSLLMKCGAKAAMSKEYIQQLGLITTHSYYRLPYECSLAMAVDNPTHTEDAVLNIVKTLIKGGATTSYPHEPQWLYALTGGSALLHAIRHQFNHVIDFLIAHGHPIKKDCLQLAQVINMQIYVRLARLKKFNI